MQFQIQPILTIAAGVLAVTFGWAHDVAAQSGLLRNCFEKNAQFFVSHLEEVAREGQTPVMLLNARSEVVGAIAVSPARSAEYPHEATEIKVEGVELCTATVSSFLYTRSPDDNLLTWTRSRAGEVHISQDEGLLVLKARKEKSERYATRIAASFRIYSVETDGEGDSSHPDYMKDWGMPVDHGEFFYYIPKEWTAR